MNIFVVSLYGNFRLITQVSEDVATEGSESLLLSTTLLSVDAFFSGILENIRIILI